MNFGKPMHFDGDENLREYQAMEKVDKVKQEIQHLMDIGLDQRQGIFSK